MDISNKYCFYAGTARGTIEYTQCVPGQKISHTFPQVAAEITAMEWGRADDEIIVGYKTGTVSLYNTTQDKYTKNVTKLEGSGAIVGVGCWDNSVIVGRHDGIINIWNRKKLDYFSINLDEKSTLDAVAGKGSLLGTGGEFNDFKLWNVETKQCLFKAKSLGHDELNLPIPTSVRGIAFLPEDHLSVVATKEGHVLLFDDRAQRKPVVKFFEKKASYTCISSAHREKQCLVGTTRGYLQHLDLKNPAKSLKTFINFTGSVTGIVCDPTEPVIATTSLDRYLRVHNLDTKEVIFKAYLKQNLTKILMKNIVKKEEQEEEQVENVDEDAEYEKLFECMETVGEEKEKQLKKRKRIVGQGTKKKKSKAA